MFLSGGPGLGFLLHFPGSHSGGVRVPTLLYLILEPDGRFFILRGFNERSQPAMRISISNPLFNVIFWRPWNAVVPSPPAPPTTESMPAPLPPPNMPPSSAPAPAPIAV
jgi:hypothetical protein